MDLEVIIVSHSDGGWLQPCVRSLESGAGSCSYRETIVENGDDWPLPLPATDRRRLLRVENAGFAAANNVGARGSQGDFLLFLNPDTELVEGSLELLVSALRERPRTGLLAVRQVTGAGELWPSLYRFPSLPRAVAQALASERWPGVGKQLGERVLGPDHYSRGGHFDWTTGAVLAVRRQAFEEVGGFDESFFLFSEETDLCKRIQETGWEAHFEPRITFVHHAGKAGVDPAREAQMSFARLQYARKHFTHAGAAAFRAALVANHLLRFVALRFRGPTRSSSAPASRLALSVLLGGTKPPFRREQVEPADIPRSPINGARSIMGLPFDGVDEEALVRLVVERASAGQGGWIVTPNLDILRRFTRSRESRNLILAATHRVADGQPIIWASRLAGTPLPERVTGSDLSRDLPKAAARAGLSLFLLGGNPGTAAAAAKRLRARFPGLREVGSFCPPFGFEDMPDELERIKMILTRRRPDLVLVGLGFPKQERLIRTLRSELPGSWFVGVGVSFSFLAGEQSRAPAALQRLGLEWMHRLVHEPRRLFRRYLIEDLPFGFRLLGWAVGRRRSRAALTGGGAQRTWS
jgi:N-acetylglucosaminyldiphosphoundecaprenol N-acetyl-beta-D-mannosaminyltransferase